METYENKLIVLRGNSGSGKSTVARRLGDLSSRKLATVEQDYLRRFILREKESEGTDNIDLIRQTVIFALERKYDVILEGILYFPRYGRMLQELVRACPDNHVYYFDVSLEETLRRHQTKPNADEFGEEQMRQWYLERDITHFENESIIPETSSLGETVARIAAETGIVRDVGRLALGTDSIP